jgi:hypothetical protein
VAEFREQAREFAGVGGGCSAKDGLHGTSFYGAFGCEHRRARSILAIETQSQ